MSDTVLTGGAAEDQQGAAADQAGAAGQSGEAGQSGDGAKGKGGEPQPLKPFMGQLKKDYWQNKELAKLEDQNGLAEAYLNVIQTDGNKIIVPAADASDEEKIAFYDAIGRPAKAEDYELTDPEIKDEKLKPLIKFEDALKKDFSETAHKLGLTKEQVAGVYNWYTGKHVEGIQSAVQQREAAKKKAMGELRQEYGNQLESAIAKMDRAFVRYGGEALAKYMIESGAGNEPVVIRAFINIGQEMVEKETPGSEGPTGATTGPRERFAGTKGQRRMPYSSLGEKEYDPKK